MGWTITLTPSGPQIERTAGEPNPYADASLTWQTFLQSIDLASLPPAYQNEAILSALWDIYQQQAADAGGGGGVEVGWIDLVRDSATDLGKQGIASLGQQIRQNGNPDRDHIPAQNETGAKFGATLDAYNAGQISALDARALINQWNNAFLLLTQQIGSSRALKGGAEINALAQRILTTLGGPTGSGTVIPPAGVPGSGYHPGTTTIGGMNISNTTLLALGAIGVVFLMRKR